MIIKLPEKGNLILFMYEDLNCHMLHKGKFLDDFEILSVITGLLLLLLLLLLLGAITYLLCAALTKEN